MGAKDLHIIDIISDNNFYIIIHEFKRPFNINCRVVSCNNTYTNTNYTMKFNPFPTKYDTIS